MRVHEKLLNKVPKRKYGKFPIEKCIFYIGSSGIINNIVKVSIDLDLLEDKNLEIGMYYLLTVSGLRELLDNNVNAIISTYEIDLLEDTIGVGDTPYTHTQVYWIQDKSNKAIQEIIIIHIHQYI